MATFGSGSTPMGGTTAGSYRRGAMASKTPKATKASPLVGKAAKTPARSRRASFPGASPSGNVKNRMGY